MITSDPPEHDRVRRTAMRHFGPPHLPNLVASQEAEIQRIVAAVTFNNGKWLEYYAAQIERSAPFPPPPSGFDHPADTKPIPAAFPDPRIPTGIPDVVLTGHDPTERGAEFRAPHR